MSAGLVAVRTLAVTVDRPRAEVFALLADVEALPRWAADFCERIELSSRGWQALTSAGDWFVEVAAEERSGVVDWSFSDGRDCRRVLPLRVVSLPGGQTLVSAVLVHWPELDDVAFERECAVFADALRRVGEALEPSWRNRGARKVV